MIERIEAVVPADGQEAGGGQTAIQDLRNRFADPVKIGPVGMVVKRENQQQSPVRRGRGCGRRVYLRGCGERRNEGLAAGHKPSANQEESAQR